ncbi:MAG: chromosome segregation SMC family protein, partial [Shimia sp.]
MRFARLRLNGFKSFVDPTDLVIADGLTGVVGPNGCGKSNLLEALRWVMGENRPTAMRGGGMEDVIFAGAATRPARNFAEVALTIDNGQRLAPAGFNDEDSLEVIRRITRDVGSAYKANLKDVRARDVQMLFADASTGSHSPALVRQGQISELINAKPKARRRVLEEAAGISGLYARRHEAELKLNGAETNLSRVDDVLEQLAAQLTSLARQARQAARYREIGAALRHAEGLWLYLRWKEADAAHAAAEATLRERVTATAQAEGDARRAGKLREAAEAALPPLREEEAIAAAVLQRLKVQRETLVNEAQQAEATIERLEGRLTQLGQDLEREDALNRDAGETIGRLEWEQAEIAKAGEGHGEALAAAQDVATRSGEVLSEREGELSAKTEDAARLSARHQSATRFLSDSHRLVETLETKARTARAAVGEAQGAVRSASEAFATAQTEEGAAQQAAQKAEADLAAAEAARAALATEEATARGASAEAEGEASALRAEAVALARLVERDKGADGQLLDHLEVAKGYETALGAALADDLRAPLVGAAGSGWVALNDYEAPQPLPPGATPLTDAVRIPDALKRRMAQVGVVAAEEGDTLHAHLLPGQRLVSAEGDLWRWDGFRAAASDVPSAAALRLQQLNRLKELQAELESAEARAAEAKASHQALTAKVAEANTADKAARTARRSADQAVADAARALSRAEAERTLAEGRVETLTLSVSRHEDELTTARAQLTEAERGMADLPDLDAARAEVEDLKLAVEAARVTMMSHRAAHDELRRTGEARTRRDQQITKELSGWRLRLSNASDRTTELTERQAETTAELEGARAVPGTVAEKQAKLADELGVAEGRRKTAVDALAEGELAQRASVAAEREAERSASDAREARARAEGQRDAAAEGVANAAARIREEQEVSPQELLAQLDTDPTEMPDADKVEADVHRLRRQRDALGAVNLRAEEDAAEVQTE